MSTLLELAVLAMVATLAGATVRAATRRRAARRDAELAETGTAAFPCRITWKEGLGRRGSVYGKLGVTNDKEPEFTPRWKPPVPLPRSPHISQEPSWRTGLTTLTYTPPTHGEITILLSDGDAENVKKILGSEK
ncbi:hypothetical protein ACVNF4_01980 [Streptomyces sp. S6]